MITRRLMLSAAALTVLPLAARAGGSAHDFSFTDIDGAPLDLAEFAGRPLMIVNTASRCGFTYQYDGLQALYDAYRDKGFILIGVPSDDFGG
ncbi:MAG: glutathione peroxidase, partial [Pseudomonadota bacterium]